MQEQLSQRLREQVAGPVPELEALWEEAAQQGSHGAVGDIRDVRRLRRLLRSTGWSQVGSD
jgi:hypothetical protein